MKYFAPIARIWLACLVVAHSPLHAQVASDDAIAKDMREEVQRIPVTVTDLYGRTESRQIPITIFRPAGNGPFPLAVMNHGRAPAGKRQQQGRQRYEPLARYLVSKGFVVLLPTRVGYGETYTTDFDPEASGWCSTRRIEPMAIAASDQAIATAAFAKTLPFVDASRWIVLGQSVGGMAAVSTVYRNPPGLVGGINFSGGVGGDPEKAGQPCRPELITQLWSEKASGAKVPMLWLYWENDRYWGAENPKLWHQAYVKGGGKAQMHMLAAAGKEGQDGHGSIGFDMDHWVPVVEAFLAQLGFDKPGIARKPRPTHFARIDDVDRVPARAAAREGVYRRFLEAKPPRAFAVSPSGHAGWATGDWALGRAIGYCQQRGEVCKLYAVDDDVVWAP